MTSISESNESFSELPIDGAKNGGRITAMVDICMAAGHHTLKYFRLRNLDVEAKSDQSPVTVADREAEQVARKLITEHFPQDTIHGEEFPEKKGTSSYQWIVDPIDGTKSFVCGVPLYSTLVALEKDGQAIAGAIYIPATGQMVVAANKRGCWYRASDSETWEPSKVSDNQEISKAVFLTSQGDLFRQKGAEAAFQKLEDTCWVSRSWGDGYGYLMVATGKADIMVDAICNAWDVAAMIPILNEAGGCFTDWDGQTSPYGGNGVGTNGKLHRDVLQILQGQGDQIP